MSGQFHALAALPSGVLHHRTLWEGGWVGPRADLNGS